jgi:hypothetical protein
VRVSIEPRDHLRNFHQRVLCAKPQLPDPARRRKCHSHHHLEHRSNQHTVGNFTVSIVGAVYTVTITGLVTAGVFAGDTVIRQLTGPATSITLCNLGLGTVPSLYLTTITTFL